MLYECTLKLLRMRPRTVTLDAISNDTGLSSSWLSSLLGKSPPTDPSVKKIERLYTYLSGKDLPINGVSKRTNGFNSMGGLEICQETESKQA